MDLIIYNIKSKIKKVTLGVSFIKFSFSLQFTKIFLTGDFIVNSIVSIKK